MMVPVSILGCAVMMACYAGLARDQARKGERLMSALSSLTAAVWLTVGVLVCL